MNLDGRGRHLGQVTRQLAEARGPVPPLVLVRRRHRRRARRRAGAVAAALIAVVAAVTVQVRQHADEHVASPPRSAGRVAAMLHLGGQLGQVRAEAAAVWVQRSRDLVQVDPRTDRVVASLPLDPPGSALGAVGDGSLWLTQVAQGTVTRVDPASGRTVATIRVPGAEAPVSIDVAVGAHAVWLGYDLGINSGILVCIDPKTNTVAATARIADSPGALAIGDRTVMVLTGESGLAYQIDAATGRVVAKVQVCRGSNDVAYGAGAFWIACDEARLLRVDPAAHRVVTTIELGAAIGSAGDVKIDGGAVWVGSLGDVLVRVDPQTNTIVDGLPVTGPGAATITDLAVGSGAVWLTTSDGTLVRFDPDG